jgi:hypothetical protein
MNASEIKRLFDLDKETNSGAIFHRGTVIGVLNTACHGESNRRLVLKVLTGKTSSKLLTDDEFYALHQFVLPYKPEGGKWMSQRDDLEAMCGALLTAAVDQPGQEKMFSEEDNNASLPV